MRLVAFRRIEGWPVFTFAGRDRSAIIAGWAWSVALLAAIGLPVMLALVALVRLAEERARQETIARTAQAEDTVRRNAAAALRASEARYRTLSEVAADVVWSRLETGSMPAPQPSWESFTAQTASQYRGFGWQDAVHPADREAAAQLWDEATAAGTAYETELRLRHRDGTWRHCLVRAARCRSPTGNRARRLGRRHRRDPAARSGGAPALPDAGNRPPCEERPVRGAGGHAG